MSYVKRIDAELDRIGIGSPRDETLGRVELLESTLARYETFALTMRRWAEEAEAEERRIAPEDILYALDEAKLYFPASSVSAGAGQVPADTIEKALKENAPITREHALRAAQNAVRNQGYAVAMHGSQVKDLDLLAVPWRDTAVDAQGVAEIIAAAIPGVIEAGSPERKPHGRLSFTIRPMSFCGFDRWYVDLAVMPRECDWAALAAVHAPKEDTVALYTKGPSTYTTACTCTCDSTLPGYHRWGCGVFARASKEDAALPDEPCTSDCRECSDAGRCLGVEPGASACTNGPDPETGDWPCDRGDDDVCTVCGWEPAAAEPEACVCECDRLGRPSDDECIHDPCPCPSVPQEDGS